MKEIEFKGKVAVVTGAGSGMGLRASQEFARLGATVILFARLLTFRRDCV